MKLEVVLLARGLRERKEKLGEAPRRRGRGGAAHRRSSDEVEVLQWWRRGENSSMALVEIEGVGESEGV